MLEEENLVQIAKVLKSNGTDGGVLMGFRYMDPEDIDLKEPVFIYFDGLPVPFFIESLSRRGESKAIVRLTGVSCLEDSEEIVGQEVFVDKNSLGEACDNEGEAGFDEMDGWTFVNCGIVVGVVSGFEDIPGNPCLYVTLPDGNEVMVPLHEDLLEAIDPELQEIRMTLPEGLF